MLNKNETYITEITGYSDDGSGIGRVDGFVVFIPRVLIGETVKVLIVKVLKNYAYGKAIEILSPSNDRTENLCAHCTQCGGCSLWHMAYEAELELKRMKVTDAVKRLGGIDVEVESTVPSPLQTEYRNKAQYPVSPEGIGFYAQRSHRVIPVGRCLIQNTIDEKIILEVKKYMTEHNISAYNEVTHDGIIRNIFVRTAHYTKETLVCIVTRTKNLPNSDVLVRALSAIEGVASIVQNINPDKTNVVLGKKNITLWGKDKITEELNGLKFLISPHSFFQVNTLQAEQLYQKAIEFAGLSGKETAYDLYCGTGTISLLLAQHAKTVIGVECVSQAVEDAKINAKNNNINNVVFHLGNAEDTVINLCRDNPADVVILDPPRKGCDKKLLDTIQEMAPARVVYVSCNPSTLARDIKLLPDYTPARIVPFDMFPRTPHVETVCLLTRTEK